MEACIPNGLLVARVILRLTWRMLPKWAKPGLPVCQVSFHDFESKVLFALSFFCSMKKAYANACNGGTTTSTTTSATTASTTTTKSTTTTTASTTTGSGSGSSGCVQWWIGDGFCDPENNKKACRFDGGDCCAPYAHPHWDWSCKWTNVRFVTIKYVIFRLVILVFFSNVFARNEDATTTTP